MKNIVTAQFSPMVRLRFFFYSSPLRAWGTVLALLVCTGLIVLAAKRRHWLLVVLAVVCTLATLAWCAITAISLSLAIFCPA